MRLTLPLLLLLSNLVLGQVPEKDKRPENLPKDINASFLNPDLNVDEFIGRFEVESREVFACREQIYNALKIQSGMAVADIGSGTGLFLEPLSKGAGETGKVFAVEISPKFIKHLRQRADQESLKNVEVVFCSDRDANLKPNSVDRALICDVYHHFEYPASTMKSIYDAMKTGGKLVVVDFNRIEGKSRQWTMDHVRAGKEVFQKEILDAGFKLEGEVEVKGFNENYLLVFNKL